MVRILLIEDDDTIAFGIRTALERKGYQVTSGPGMAEGKRLFSGGISLILLDLNLPDGSGYEFCRWVKERRDTDSLCIQAVPSLAAWIQKRKEEAAYSASGEAFAAF